MQLFELASEKAAWLAARQAAVASNIANVNTPGYRARDVRPFADLLASGGPSNDAPAQSSFAGALSAERDGSWEVLASGNSVTVEGEMLKAGQIAQDYSLDTAVTRSFQNMLLSVTKS